MSRPVPHGAARIASPSLVSRKPVARQQPVGLRVPDHRLDGLAALEQFPPCS